MTTVSLELATVDHAARLARTLRADDLAECLAFGYPDARSALVGGIFCSSEAWAVLFDGEVAAVLGVNPLAQGVALVWALTGRAVELAHLTFMRTSKSILAALLRKHRVLTNHVDARYTAALNWLDVLGFRIEAPAPHPETGALACLVSIGRA